MPIDPEKNVKLLTVIHTMQIAAAESCTVLTTLIENAQSNTVTLLKEQAESIGIVLDTQNQLVRHLLEENETMRDGLERFEAKLNQML